MKTICGWCLIACALFALLGQAKGEGNGDVGKTPNAAAATVAERVDRLGYYNHFFQAFAKLDVPDGTCFLHREPQGLAFVIKVQQAVPGGAIVALDPRVCAGPEADVSLFVATSKQYRDGQWLPSNVYVADGNYEYTTVLGATRRIRKFKELEPELTEELFRRLDENARKIEERKKEHEALAKRQWNEKQEQIKSNLYQAVASCIGSNSFSIEHSVYTTSNLLSNIESIRIVNLESMTSSHPDSVGKNIYKQLREAQIKGDWKQVFELLWPNHNNHYEGNEFGKWVKQPWSRSPFEKEFEFREDVTNLVMDVVSRNQQVPKGVGRMLGVTTLVVEIKLRTKMDDGHALCLITCKPPDHSSYGDYGDLFVHINPNLNERSRNRHVFSEFGDSTYRVKVDHVDAPSLLVYGGILLEVDSGTGLPTSDEFLPASSSIKTYYGEIDKVREKLELMTEEEKKVLNDKTVPTLFFKYLDEIKKHFRCFGEQSTFSANKATSKEERKEAN